MICDFYVLLVLVQRLKTKQNKPTVNAQEFNGSKLVSYILCYKADDATGEVLPGAVFDEDSKYLFCLWNV